MQIKSTTTNARPPTQTSAGIIVPSTPLIDLKNSEGDDDKLFPQSTTKTFTSTLENLQPQKIEDQTFTEKITTTSREESLFG